MSTMLQEAATAPGAAETLMSLRGVRKTFGALTALDDVGFEIRRGEVLGVAGPNGAGKTTLLNVCTGVLKPTAGEIAFEGRRIDRFRPHRRCHLGLARTFQIPQIFHSMSVRENVETGALFGPGGGGDGRAVSLDQALELTELAPRQHASVDGVDLLTRKRIMLAAALATDPKLIFFDEPMAGLNAAEVAEFVALFQRLHAALDLTFVVVEHKMRALEALSHRILILNFGQVLTIDAPDRVLSDQRVIDIYLGTKNLA